MALPKQVQEQLKEVEALEKQLQAQADPAEETEVAPQTPEPVTPVEAAPAQPVATNPDEDTWQRRYETLIGKYNAEVPRLHDQVRELSNRLAAMSQPPEPKEPPKDEKPTKLVTDQDVEAFGEDLIDLQRRVAQEVSAKYDAHIERLEAQNAALLERLQSTGSQVQAMSFEQRLQEAVPDFAQINADPRWVAWLNEPVPELRGAPRRVVAQQAFDAQDVEAVADYVKLFRASLPTTQTDRQTELNRQVAPSRGASASVPQTQTAKVYTTADIDKMFIKVRDLNIAQKYDQAAKLEAEINAAYVEGRVRP